MASATLTPESAWSAPVLPQDVQTPPDVPAKYTDEAVLSIVIKDYERAAAWLDDHRFPLGWTEADLLYNSPRTLSVFEGSAVTRANVSRFQVAQMVNALAPAITAAIFSDTTPFEIRPRPGANQNSARAWKELLSEILEDISFKQECMSGIQSMVCMGTIIYKLGWETTTQVETHYRRKAAPPTVQMPIGPPLTMFTAESDEFTAYDIEVTRNRPTFERMELGRVFPDPTWRNPNQLWKAKWVVQMHYLTYDDLDNLRSNPDYDIPSEEQLRAIFLQDVETPKPISSTEEAMLAGSGTIHHAQREDFDDSEDPLQKPLQVLEWWSKDQVRVVLQQKVVIRNTSHNLGALPFVSANFWDIENAGFGLGVGRISGSQQRASQACLNAILDILAFAVQPEFAISRGANVPTQDQRRRLGGIRLVDGDAARAIALVPQPQVPPGIWQALQALVSDAESSAGADMATVQGAIPGHGSSIVRTGTGAGIVGQASSNRLQSPVDRFVEGVFLPFLRFTYRMIKERMPMSEVRQILAERTDDLAIDFQDFLEMNVKFDTLAGSRLAAKTKMAQSLPFLFQFLGNPAIVQQLSETGFKVDVQELIRMALDNSEYKNYNDLIVKLTPEELQTQQMQKQAAMEMNSRQALMHQKQQGDLAMEDKKIAGRIAVNTIRQTHKAAVDTPIDRAEQFFPPPDTTGGM